MTGQRLTLRAKENLRDALLAIRAISDPATRTIYVDELQSELGLALVVPRFTDARHDIWSIITACESHPGGLTALVAVVTAIHGEGGQVDRVRAAIDQATGVVEKSNPAPSSGAHRDRERLRILYLTAAPALDLRLDSEMRAVRASLRAGTYRDRIEIEAMTAATGSDLLDGLTRFRPHALHFSGHAGEQSLTFDPGDIRVRTSGEMAAATFVAALEAVDHPPRLVVLNACNSEAQLDALTSVASAAIGMSDRIRDDAAIQFAARLYGAIADGQSVGSALRLGRVELDFRGTAAADLPALRTASGIDAATLFLLA
jgi:hypothetical protein